MADYSTAAANAISALENASEGMVEEYEIRTNGRRVKFGRAKEQLEAILVLQGLAARTTVCNVAKFKNPR